MLVLFPCYVGNPIICVDVRIEEHRLECQFAIYLVGISCLPNLDIAQVIVWIY